MVDFHLLSNTLGIAVGGDIRQKSKIVHHLGFDDEDQ